jgi:hypothetical protein
MEPAMIRAMVLLLLVAATPAPALTLSDLAGRWRGEGGYVIGTEPPQRLRCQMRGTPTARGVALVGRCATAQGGQSFAWSLTSRGDGTIRAEDMGPVPDDAPTELSGRIDADGLRFASPDGGSFDLAWDAGGLILRLRGTEAGQPVRAEARLLPEG